MGPLKYNENNELKLVKGNLISDMWNSFWQWVFNPTEQTFWYIFAVSSSYFVMPLVGGYIRSESYQQFMAK